MNQHEPKLAPVYSGNGQAARDVRPAPGDLPPDILRQLAGSLKSQWKRYRKKLKRCQKRFSEEAVHDSRVETRRLLSLIELLASFLPAACVKKVECALKRHLDTFDDLRDTQVQLLAIDPMRRVFPAAKAFHKHLLKREARFTRRTRKEIKRVKTSRLGKPIIVCRKEVTARSKRCAPLTAGSRLLRSVNSAFARTWQLHARIDPRDTTTIHCARVAFKKFRYMVETLAGFLPAVDEKFCATMHHYQTMMGDIQDTEVLLKTLDKYLLKKRSESESGRRLRQELLRRRQELIRTYLSAADQLLEFWSLPETRDNPLPARRSHRLKGSPQ